MNRHNLSRGRKAALLSAILAGACVIAVMPQAASAMSLKEAVSLVMQTNPDVNGAMRDRRATDYELRQARGLYYPQVDFHAAGGPEWTESSSVDEGDANLSQSPHDNGIGMREKTAAFDAMHDHFGLLGMKERAARVSARLEINGEARPGTQVSLRIPARIAYARDSG